MPTDSEYVVVRVPTFTSPCETYRRGAAERVEYVRTMLADAAAISNGPFVPFEERLERAAHLKVAAILAIEAYMHLRVALARLHAEEPDLPLGSTHFTVDEERRMTFKLNGFNG